MTKHLVSELEGYTRRGPRAVLLLEGSTDPEAFFALLGVPRPAAGIHERILVVGLKQASGGSAVKTRCDEAQRHDHLRDWIFGIVDGDGAALAELAPRFDAPCAGPLFNWKAYCIENLLAQTGAWPKGWGDPPDWATELAAYAPYVALNRLHRELRDVLNTLRLRNFTNPREGEPLLHAADVEAALERDKGLLAGTDVAQQFRSFHADFLTQLSRSLIEAHCQLNGKWLINHLAVRRARRSPEDCRTTWCDAVREAGGHPDVQDLWRRICALAP